MIFWSCCKRIFRVDVFIIIYNFLEVYVSTTSDFQMRTNRGKQQYYNRRKQIRYFNIINIVEGWCKIGVISESSVINQNSIKQFRITKFFQMALFDSWKIWYVFASYEKVSYMYHFLCHRSFLHKRFRDSVHPQTPICNYIEKHITAVLFSVLLHHYCNIFSFNSPNVCIK